jgi:outer membrane protein assembly factor BamB
LILGVTMILHAVPAHAVIIRLLPVKDILGDSTFVLTAKVELLDKDKQLMMLVADDYLKGKGPFTKLPIVLKGDEEATKGKQVPILLKRLAPKMQLVLFLKQTDKDYIGFVYTNGTWFQITGSKPEDSELVRWSFTHCEPYMRRTFKGTTAEMAQLLKDVQEGKAKPPEPNPKEQPGYGPEVSEEKPEKPGEKPANGALRLHGGPVFAVIPSVLVGGPLAVLSMLFPTLFGGWRRWLALISVVCTTSTVYLLQWWFGPALAGTIWATPQLLWIMLTIITLIGAFWAWQRYVRQVESGTVNGVPSGVETGILLFLSVVGLAALGYCWKSGDTLLSPAWMQVLVVCTGAWVATGYVFWARMRTARQAPALATEVVMLFVMALTSTVLMAGQPGGRNYGGRVETGEGLMTTLDDHPVQPGQLAWRWSPADLRGSISSTPLVAGDRVYIALAHEDTFNPQGIVYCLDRKDGHKIWDTKDRLKKMKPISLSSPCLADGRLYVGEGFHENPDCKLYCLNADTGEKIWEFQTASHVESSPVAVDGKVYFGAGDDGLFCVDPKSGQEVWHYPGVHVDSKPLIYNKRLYAGAGEGDFLKPPDHPPAIVCLDIESGKEVWKHTLDMPCWGGPVLAAHGNEAHLYFGIGNGRFNKSDETDPKGALLCVRADTGAEAWRYKTKDGVLNRPTVDRTRVYFGSRDEHLYCVNRKTGELCWKQDLGSPVISTVALAHSDQTGDTTSVYALSDAGLLLCLGSKTGQRYWEQDLVRLSKGQPMMVWSSPAVVVTADDKGLTRRLYFGATAVGSSNTPVVFCFEDRLEQDTILVNETR